MTRNHEELDHHGVGMATQTAITSAALLGKYNADEVDDVPRQVHCDLTLTWTRRGLHDTLLGTKSRNPGIRAVPENVRASINDMGKNNTGRSDLRAHDSGGVILFHAPNLGCTTGVGPTSRAKNYVPRTANRNPAPSVFTYSQQKLKPRAVGVTVTTNFRETAEFTSSTGPQHLGFRSSEVNERWRTISAFLASLRDCELALADVQLWGRSHRLDGAEARGS